MAILLPKDTCTALGADARECESRSLLFDRFADPSAKDSSTQTSRKVWFKRVISLKPLTVKRDSWTRWLCDLGLKTEDILLAKLQSRLMVNMAGGVMENAGLCLDRFGMPYIPGSAVKGSARRMAIAALHEWCESGIKPISEGDAIAIVCASYGEPATLLADIARVFGWGKEDWGDKKKDGRFISDFAFATGEARWTEIRKKARTLLLGGAFDEKVWSHRWNQFAGCVSFLPAYPRELPPKDLELDVVTCHHPRYYQGELLPATDTEDPNPVTFIAVAAEAVFAFGALPLRGDPRTLSQPGMMLHLLARDWLRQGLETFGVGSKTAAGYGWFVAIGTAMPKTPQSQILGAMASAAGATSAATAEHPLIRQWRGKTQPANFRVFRPLLAALRDDTELKDVFEAIMPGNELAKLKRSNRYWQSFISNPEGAAILKRLKLELR